MSAIDHDCLRALRASTTLPLSTGLRKSRPWASALFAGRRLTIAVESDDDMLFDDWLVALPETELAWRDHFVASAEVVERSANMAIIELLVIEAKDS